MQDSEKEVLTPAQYAIIQNVRRESETAIRFVLLEAKVDGHAQELKGFRAQLQVLTSALGGLASQLTKQQESMDSVLESMVFVKKLETMDSSLSLLTKFAKGTLVCAGFSLFLLTAYKTSDGAMFEAAMKLMLTWVGV